MCVNHLNGLILGLGLPQNRWLKCWESCWESGRRDSRCAGPLLVSHQRGNGKYWSRIFARNGQISRNDDSHARSSCLYCSCLGSGSGRTFKVTSCDIPFSPEVLLSTDRKATDDRYTGHALAIESSSQR